MQEEIDSSSPLASSAPSSLASLILNNNPGAADKRFAPLMKTGSFKEQSSSSRGQDGFLPLSKSQSFKESRGQRSAKGGNAQQQQQLQQQQSMMMLGSGGGVDAPIASSSYESASSMSMHAPTSPARGGLPARADRSGSVGDWDTNSVTSSGSGGGGGGGGRGRSGAARAIPIGGGGAPMGTSRRAPQSQQPQQYGRGQQQQQPQPQPQGIYYSRPQYWPQSQSGVYMVYGDAGAGYMHPVDPSMSGPMQIPYAGVPISMEGQGVHQQHQHQQQQRSPDGSDGTPTQHYMYSGMPAPLQRNGAPHRHHHRLRGLEAALGSGDGIPSPSPELSDDATTDDGDGRAGTGIILLLLPGDAAV